MTGMGMDVFSNVIGGLIVILLITFWNEIVPRIAQLSYRGEPKISGKWKTTFKENENQYHEKVTLWQKGRKVKGEIVLLESGGDSTTYKFEGSFKHLILRATYESTDPEDYEQGAFALGYTRRGTFKGQYILFGKESDELISSDYEWHRA